MDYYDVVIIGGGLAGTTIAHHLPNNIKIAIIEKGEYEYSKKINTHDYGTLSDIGYGNFPIQNYSVNFSSTKMVGGNNNIWSGWSIPLQKKELKDWPIEYSEIEKYYRLTEKFFNFDSFDEIQKNDEYQKFDSDKWKIKFWQFGNKKIKIKKILESNKNIELFTNSNFREFVVEGDEVKKILFTQNNIIHKINCKVVVLAQGGLETTKTLLNTKFYLKKQIGNENGHLGKFYMEHPHISLGHFYDNNNLVGNLFNKKENKKAGLFLEKSYFESIINGLMLVDNHDLHSRQDVYKLLFIFRLLSIPKNIFKNRKIISVIFQLIGATFQYLYSKIRNKKFVVGIFEQTPNINSTIDLDDNGKLKLNWQISEKDILSIISITNLFKEYLALNVSKEISFDKKIYDIKNWQKNYKDKILGIGHHMGTTKMSKDKKNGVVNENLKLHFNKNLYVCSSSTFPTGGVGHPTFTICALAIRLASHLKKNFFNK